MKLLCSRAEAAIFWPGINTPPGQPATECHPRRPHYPQQSTPSSTSVLISFTTCWQIFKLAHCGKSQRRCNRPDQYERIYAFFCPLCYPFPTVLQCWVLGGYAPSIEKTICFITDIHHLYPVHWPNPLCIIFSSKIQKNMSSLCSYFDDSNCFLTVL